MESGEATEPAPAPTESEAAPEEPAAEPAAVAEPTKKRRRWSEPVAQPDPPPALPGSTSGGTAISPGAPINPALIMMAPALNSLFNRPAAAAAPVDGTAHGAAQDALRRVQQMIGGGVAGMAAGGGLAGDASTKETLEININDCSNKGQLTKKATQEDISRATGVSIRICGRYKPPGDTSTDDPPLYLRCEPLRPSLRLTLTTSLTHLRLSRLDLSGWRRRRTRPRRFKRQRL